MIGLIRTEVLEMIPYAVALCAICLLCVIVALISRAVTIHSMKRFWPEISTQMIDELSQEIKTLKAENNSLRVENNEHYVTVKAFKALAEKVVV